MATFKELMNDWSVLCEESAECWNSDLQLAAELGKTLLERNKELENIIKLHQSTIDEQAQEIEYMKKQTVALREVNDSRLKIYEQLEVSIQDLERANHRLVIENTSDKKLIKSQCLTIENLEARSEELQKKIDELSTERNILLRQQQSQSLSASLAQSETASWKAAGSHGGSIEESAAPGSPKSFQPEDDESVTRQASPSALTNEEETELLRQLKEARSQRSREQKKLAELEQQLAQLMQENAALEEQLTICRNKAMDLKNLQEEINTLEEFRRDQLCGRCQRGIDTGAQDDLSAMLNQDEFDDVSIADSFHEGQRETETLAQVADTKQDTENCNAYKDLVEKYEHLIEVQRHPFVRRKNSVPATQLSLQEELQMSGEFNSFHNTASESEHQQESNKSSLTANGVRGKVENGKKAFSATPTDFSEAETSSSGFSDETSNKATQTDGRLGSYLCSIANGDNCTLSIYDENSTFENRFQNMPHYKLIFQDMFSTLKRMAETKNLTEQQSSPNDTGSTTCSQANTTQDDLVSETTDDNQSVMSSVVSSVVSEPLYRVHTPVMSQRDEKANRTESVNGSAPSNKSTENGVRLDYVSVKVGKTSSSRKNGNRRMTCDRLASDIVPTTNPKLVPPKSNGGSRRRFRPFNLNEECTWDGHSQVYSNSARGIHLRRTNDVLTRATPKSDQYNSFEYAKYKTGSASETVANLKRLDQTYAEVLRTPNKGKVSRHNHRRN